MFDTFKRSSTTHMCIALLAGIATIAKARTLDHPSTTFSAALASSVIFMIACFMVNRAEAATPKRCEWLIFTFYARSLLALTIALIAVMITTLKWSWTFLLAAFLLWCLTSLSKATKENAFESLVLSPTESTEATNRLTTLTVIQTIIFAITLFFL